MTICVLLLLSLLLFLLLLLLLRLSFLLAGVGCDVQAHHIGNLCLVSLCLRYVIVFHRPSCFLVLACLACSLFAPSLLVLISEPFLCWLLECGEVLAS